jgi:transcriptional regulator with XRE-family HTH domain
LRLYKNNGLCHNYAMQRSEFVIWLDQELLQHGWSDHQLARRAGLSHSVISKARSGTAPKWEACEALARALDLPPEIVFRKAGLLTPLPSEPADLEEWRYLLFQLPERDRYELLQIARLKLSLSGGN